MSYLYLLDTNIISDLIKHPQGKCFDKVKDVGEDKICTSVIVACELRFGVAKKNSSRLENKVNSILNLLRILPITSEIEPYYARIRNSLEQQGTPIGGNDLLIAAHALSLDLIIVTNNIREFGLVPLLHHENWLE